MNREQLLAKARQIREQNGYVDVVQLARDFAALVFCLLIVGFGIVVVTQYNTDASFRTFIIEQVREKFSSVVSTVIILAGVKWMKK